MPLADVDRDGAGGATDQSGTARGLFEVPDWGSRGGWRAIAAIGLAAMPVAMADAADAACRQALVFALDVSGSIDDVEYRQQLDGLAGALEDPVVAASVLADPDFPLRLAAVEWASAEHAAVIFDWTEIRSEVDLAHVRDRLRGWERTAAPRQTAIGTGLVAAAAMFDQVTDCLELTIDLSADGKNNDGISPGDVHALGTLDGLTVNALLINDVSAGGDAARNLGDLEAYLDANVIGGPGAFVMVAETYADYTAAMRRKLLRELARAPDLQTRGAIGDTDGG